MFDLHSNPAMWHAINVHLPIVLAVLGLPLVCVQAITRGRSRGLRWWTVVFYAVVALCAWYTVQTGERAMGELPATMSQAAWDRINLHEKLAQVIPPLAGATGLLLLLANIPRRRVRQVFTTLALVASVVTAGWVAVAAHSGGLAVYDFGAGTMALKMPVTVATTQAAPLASAVTVTTAAPATAPAVKSASVVVGNVSYAKQIKPLLDEKCADCHKDDTIKGGFDIATIAAMTKGGKKGGAGIIAGKPDESSLVQYIEGTKKPRMPKGDDPMAEGEIALIRAWIAAGAIDDSGVKIPNAKTASVIATPADVSPAAPNPAPAVAQVQPVKPSPATSPPPPATTQKISEDWDPQVDFTPAEAVAVRRYVRLKNLPPPPSVPTTQAIAYNPIDNFIAVKFPPATAPAKVPAATTASTQPADKDLADDATFVRRVYLDLVGMIPTAEEAKKFIENKDKAKRVQLVDALLGRPKDYAGNWAPFWEEALCSNGLHQGGVGTHGNYRQWIVESFAANKPYDVFVQELLDPTMPNHPQRYVLNDNHMRTIQSSADTAQVFLGTAIKCASCHSHFLNDEWPQSRAVAFAGFFNDKDMELVRCERKSGQFVQTHFMFNLPEAPTTAPADQNQRLHQLAQLVTDPTNPRFAKTLVNRLWKRYMGLGLFEPVDDFREDTPPSHPELLEWLANDFIRHGYDVKRTVRLIMTSRTYQLRYDPKLEDHFDVAKPKDPRYFRSPGLRRLTAEQLLDSIDVMMSQHVPDRRAYQDDTSSPLTRALGKPPVRNEVSTARPEDTAVVQALELLNGPEWHDRIYKGDLVTNCAVEPDPKEIVSDIYWSTLNRAPSDKEMDAAQAFLKAAPKPATTQPVEVVWVDDELPPRAAPEGAWKFAAKPDVPVFSGGKSHTEVESTAVPAAPLQHLFTGVTFPVAPDDKLFAYVFIDSKSPPKEIMLQFLYNGDWHRASWGSSDIPFAPNHAMGELPKTGEWVRLEVPAQKLGIKKPGVIKGIAFTQFSAGKVYWDKTGAAKGPPIHDFATIGDMLWALLSSPEFQYIR